MRTAVRPAVRPAVTTASLHSSLLTDGLDLPRFTSSFRQGAEILGQKQWLILVYQPLSPFRSRHQLGLGCLAPHSSSDQLSSIHPSMTHPIHRPSLRSYTYPYLLEAAVVYLHRCLLRQLSSSSARETQSATISVGAVSRTFGGFLWPKGLQHHELQTTPVPTWLIARPMTVALLHAALQGQARVRSCSLTRDRSLGGVGRLLFVL
ncbi:hypothetical protein P280DRAFT_475156 [Massarina eburnea CBS 473.64]|uniref:Uncharacterized protein n=1 Tax=Massarina eburnea CBS 473.64 TaxID=1395130 RepID=A0A6A6SHT1_9PLEO|nr:hypothetical protein P280DRAFT_475156 [Massarina eburnea CBS 473.64]